VTRRALTRAEWRLLEAGDAELARPLERHGAAGPRRALDEAAEAEAEAAQPGTPDERRAELLARARQLRRVAGKLAGANGRRRQHLDILRPPAGRAGQVRHYAARICELADEWQALGGGPLAHDPRLWTPEGAAQWAAIGDETPEPLREDAAAAAVAARREAGRRIACGRMPERLLSALWLNVPSALYLTDPFTILASR